jgi:hypothetical protein
MENRGRREEGVLQVAGRKLKKRKEGARTVFLCNSSLPVPSKEPQNLLQGPTCPHK